MMSNKSIRKAAEEVVKKYFRKRGIELLKSGPGEHGYDFRDDQANLFIEVKGTTASRVTDVLFRSFTNGEHKKAQECVKTGKKYEVHLVVGIGYQKEHYLFPGETFLKECKRVISWELPIRKNHNKFRVF